MRLVSVIARHGVLAVLLAVLAAGSLPRALGGDDASLALTEPAGRSLVVAKDGSGDFRSIQEAVEAARSGDTIQVTRGEYREDVTIHSKERLRIVGEGREAVSVRGQGRFGVFYIGKWPYGAAKIEVSGMTIHEHGGLAFGIFNGRDVVLRDLDIRGGVFGQQVAGVRIEECRIGGSETTGVQFADSRATLLGNLIHDNDHGVSVAGRSEVRLERNVIMRSLFEAVLVKDRARASLVRNTLVKNGGGAAFLDESSGEARGNIVGYNRVGFRVGTKSRARFSHNGLYNSGENYVRVGPEDEAAHDLNGSDIIGNPRFVDVERNDFRLRPDTPLIQVGGFSYLGALAPVSSE